MVVLLLIMVAIYERIALLTAGIVVVTMTVAVPLALVVVVILPIVIMMQPCL